MVLWRPERVVTVELRELTLGEIALLLLEALELLLELVSLALDLARSLFGCLVEHRLLALRQGNGVGCCSSGGQVDARLERVVRVQGCHLIVDAPPLLRVQP